MKKLIKCLTAFGDISKLKNSTYEDLKQYDVYANSIREHEGAAYFIARTGSAKKLIAYGYNNTCKFAGEESMFNGKRLKICKMDNENSEILRDVFPFTKPVSQQGKNISFGLGDRLGIASPGHIKLIRDKNIFPILAQQSIRELNLTRRSFTDVLSAASWAVFQEGYTGGFGADGDHLQDEEEIKFALNSGFTMITLDCLRYVDKNVSGYTQTEVNEIYSSLPDNIQNVYNKRYNGKVFNLDNGVVIKFETDLFRKIVLTYYGVIQYVLQINRNVIKKSVNPADFEISIDETEIPTIPEAHFFIASELLRGGVNITSLAPRFCGEFQKGIDYIGDIREFTAGFKKHSEIAKHFGYKISIHSGSDKFRIYPIISKETHGRYHLKTSGTNWLEAIRVIAVTRPDLFRKIYDVALLNLDNARMYYHVNADICRLPVIDTLTDNELQELMNFDDVRQVLHISYGFILTKYKSEIYSVLYKYEDEYYQSLIKHIGKHCEYLQI